MAWDKDRPVAPFFVYGEGTAMYERGERERMGSFVYYTLKTDDIDRIWDNDGATYAELSGNGDGYGGVEFRPFVGVPMTLSYDGMQRGRSDIVFMWRDQRGTRYPMFATEIDRLIRIGRLSREICGRWSAEKRGMNYGICLDGPTGGIIRVEIVRAGEQDPLNRWNLNPATVCVAERRRCEDGSLRYYLHTTDRGVCEVTRKSYYDVLSWIEGHDG